MMAVAEFFLSTRITARVNDKHHSLIKTVES